MRTATGWLVIANGQLVDGTGARPVRDGAVVIDNGRIAYAGPAAGMPTVPVEAPRLDVRGGTILPGLVERISIRRISTSPISKTWTSSIPSNM